MYPISSAFAAAITTGYRMVVTANVISNGLTVLSGVPISDGTITVDRAAAQRRRANITIATVFDGSVVPINDLSPLTPYGNELSLGVGWIDPSTGSPYINPATGQVERVPMGVYPMVTVDVTDTGTDVAIAVEAYDRSWTVAQRKFRTPWIVAAGTPPESAIQAILNAQYPGLPALNMAPTGFALPAAAFKEGDDPWAACLTLADTAGCELAFDVNGVPTGFPIPDPTTRSPVWSYRTDGTGNAAPTSIKRTLTRSAVSNDFIVSGTGSANAPTGTGNTTGPVRAEVSDDNPSSVTYVNGPFGDIPTFVTSSLVTTTAAAAAGAQNALTSSLGQVESYVVAGAPAPMFDVDDVVGLFNARQAVDCSMVVDAASLSLRHDGSTQLTGRLVG